mgnify:CR=1 FL=1
MIPLKFHENIIIELNNRKISQKNKMTFIIILAVGIFVFYLFNNDRKDVKINVFSSADNTGA